MILKQCRRNNTMSNKWVPLVLLFSIFYYGVYANSSNEEYDYDNNNILTIGLLPVFNETMTNLDRKVCNAEKKCAATEATLDAYTKVLDNVRGCNAGFTRKLEELKQSIAIKMYIFSKKIERIEDRLRILQDSQVDIRELVNTTCIKTCDDDEEEDEATKAPAKCDQGWIESPTKCYLVSKAKMEWQSAVDNCRIVEANLVEIRSDREAAFLFANMPNRIQYSDIIYTGRKKNYAGTWVFLSDGEAVDLSVQTWGMGEPHGGTQKCGCIRMRDNLKMLDCYCTGYDLHYICEKLIR